MLIATAAVAALAVVPVAGAIPQQTATPVTAHVTPGTGGPRTTFTLSWRNPGQTGTDGSARRTETVEITGHLMDSGVLARVLDDVLDYGGDYTVDRIDLGKAHQDESHAVIVVDQVERMPNGKADLRWAKGLLR